MNQTKITKMLQEKIDELEVSFILQKDMLELLKTENVPGEMASQWGARLQTTENEVAFTEKYLTYLKKKYS